MATIYTQAIQEMYVAYFNRPADPAGLAYWEGVVAASAGDTAAVAAAFAGSAEFKAEYEDLNTTGTLRQIYRNLFNDEADAAGLAYWSDLVATGKLSIDKAVTAIAAGAQGVHDVTFNNKVAVATAFTAALDTDAEKAGYNGEMANTAAKEFLATITDNASATAALVPATLAATVADVIAAGVEFTLPTALAAYAAAVEAQAAYLAAADGDDDEDTSIDLNAAQAEIDADLTLLVTGYDVLPLAVDGDAANSAGVNAALVADAIKAKAAVLTAATKTLTEATTAVSKVTNLSGYIANLEAAEATVVATAKAAVLTDSDVAGKIAAYNALNVGDEELKADITDAGVLPGLIKLSGTTLVLETGVTETNSPGVTALLAAIKADVAADKAAAAAVLNEAVAQRLVDRTDVVAADVKVALEALQAEMDLTAKPTAIQLEAYSLKLADALTTAEGTADAQDDIDAQAEIDAFDALLLDLDTDDAANAVSDAYLNAVGAVEAAAEAVADLDEVVDAQAELNLIVAEAGDLQDAVDAAADLFAENDYAAPVTLTAFVAGTAATDIFVAGTENSTILSFASDDLLFIGTEYTLVKGALSTGDNAKLEAFMSQEGANTVIRLETKVFGSNSADAEIVITLNGVNMTDLTLANGIIS